MLSPGPAKRSRSLLLLSLVLTALIAAGLPRLVFRPGLPPPSFDNGQVVLGPAETAPVGMGLGSFSLVMLLLAFAIPLVVLLVRALRGVPWKKLLVRAWSLAWKLVLVAGVLVLVVRLLPRSEGSAASEPLPPPRPLVTAPLGPVPGIVIWIAAIALGAAVVGVSLWVLLRRRPRPQPAWELEVAHARQALLDGGDLRAVIIRCYTRMAEALQEERGIERVVSMTTGEFETLLDGKGLPREPIRQLTRLFDAARYSQHEPLPGEERIALSCLDSILEGSRRLAPPEGAA
jgi:hypothetical protein